MEGWGTLRVVLQTGGTSIVDVSCGSCSRCIVDLDFWCTRHLSQADGTLLAEVNPAPSENTLMVALGLSALASHSSIQTPVLIEAPEVQVAQALVDLLAQVQTFVTADSRSAEARSQVATASETGRAGTVLNVVDHGKAVRAVERGGTVVFTPSDVKQPTLTEVVQRELSVIGVTSLAHLRNAGVKRLSEALAGGGAGAHSNA